MLSTYCQECGAKNEYRFTKPKFCSSCGSSLDGSGKVNSIKPEQEKRTLPKSSPQRSEGEEIDDPDGTDIYEVPYIENLSYDIEISQNSFSLGDLFKNIESESKPTNAKAKTRGRPKKK